MQGPALGLFRTYVAPHRRQALLLATLLAANIGLQLVNPQLLRYVIDSALAGADLTFLTLAALAFIVVALATQLFAAGAQYVGESLGWTATNSLRADLTLHCLRLDLGFHKARTPGELVERIDGDVTALAGFFSRFAVTLIGNAALLVGVLFMLWREDWRAGAALTAFAVIAVGVLLSLRTVAVDRWRRQREVSAQMFGFFGERLAGTEDIRSSGAVPYVMRELGLHHAAWLAARRGASVGTSAIYSATIVTFAAGTATAFAVGGSLWLAGAITLGTVYLLFYYTELLRRPIEQIRRELEDMQQAFASISRVDELLRVNSRLRDGARPLPTGPLDVAFERVSFAYDQEPVLREVTVRIAPGRILGLLGRTGSGKTTIARLLLRFYDPASGAVRLGGIDLRESPLDDIRGRVTLVSQDVQLFHASVRDNVTLFDRAIDDARTALALDRIGLGEWLARAGGLDAEMTADSLSAGEAQLLALARAFLRDPGLVILDEASSRLDPATERRLERAIDTLLAGRTGLVIAHRIETLDRCDEIAIIETGRVVEHGARTALAADGSTRFAELLRAGLEQVLA
jgi:ABC-type multidrug transport system fused ATPase/permease subunit